jgi:hypothetical protein
MLTTTGRAIIIVFGALVGLGIGVVVGLTTPLPFAELIGAAIGAAIAYVLTLLWI